MLAHYIYMFILINFCLFRKNARHKSRQNRFSWLAAVDNHGSVYVTVASFVVTDELNANSDPDLPMHFNGFSPL
jgi:hypothetical protein